MLKSYEYRQHSTSSSLKKNVNGQNRMPSLISTPLFYLSIYLTPYAASSVALSIRLQPFSFRPRYRNQQSIMSPAKFYVDHHDQQQNARKEINGPRPSPLKINIGSHIIHKSSSASSSSNSSSVSACVATMSPNHISRPQRHGPVIIYTHSPKIIHTQARDFMALVQKLTGLSRSSETAPPPAPTSYEKDDNNETSSAVTDETCGGGAGGPGDANNVTSSSSTKSPMFKSSSPCFADIPLFTPNSSELFCSPRPYFRYPADTTAFESPNVGNLISPSLMEFMKGLR